MPRRTPKRSHSAFPGIAARAEDGFRPALTVVALAFPVLVFALYSAALHGPLVFDDVELRSWVRFHVDRLADVRHILLGPGIPRRIGRASLALNFYFGRLDPFGYHVVNVALHALNGILLFLFSRRLLSLLGPEHPWASRRALIAAFGAALWLVHPVQTQAVAYVWQRFTTLSAAFFLAALILYLRARTGPRRSRTWAYALGAAFALLALGTKENTATLPLLVAAIELLLLRSLRVEPGRARRALLLLLGAFVLIAAFYLGPRFVQLMSAAYEKRGFTPAERLLTELRVVVYYVSLLALPHPSRLQLDYDVPLSRSLLSPPTTLASLGVIAALVALAVRERRRRPLLALAILWFFGNLAIESSVIPLDLVYEHRLYVPSMLALVYAAGWLLARPWPAPARWGPLAAVLLVFSGWTLERVRLWADPALLFADNARKAPNKARVHNHLGQALLGRGDRDAAAAAFERSLELDPGHVPALNALAFVELRRRRPAEARRLLERALAADAEAGPALHSNLGSVCLELGDFAAAVRHLEAAARLDPENPPLLHNLGLAYLKAGEPLRAAAALERAVTLAPADARLYSLLAGAYREAGQPGRAEEVLQRRR